MHGSPSVPDVKPKHRPIIPAVPAKIADAVLPLQNQRLSQMVKKKISEFFF
jgi:hypothetical protein